MSIFSSSVSICHFQVVGDLPQENLFQWAAERLSRQGFRPIDEGVAELSTGWVHTTNTRESSFEVPAHFWHDNYLLFSLRQDRRKIPGALFKAYLQVAEHDFLSANPGLKWVPKQKKQEMKDNVQLSLLAKTLPTPSCFDIVWDTRTGILTYTSLGRPAIEALDVHFRKTFEGFRLLPLHPFARAETVVDPGMRQVLAKFNRATSDAVLDLVGSNRWLGEDFLLWLMHRSMNGHSGYAISAPGPALEGESFVAYLDDRLVLSREGEEGKQKITVAGPQDRFGEVCTALRSGKVINEAAIYLEQGEDLWKMTLKGELFHFASFRTPKIKEERDNTVDEDAEKAALFFEKMHLLEKGLQMFDSLLKTFLAERLDRLWESRLEQINEWLAES